jgi:Zn-dependent protease
MSLKIGRFFGINLYIHWSFWLLPLWVLFSHTRDPEADSLGLHLALLGVLFACVVLHEYGHALMARWFGIQTRDVTLYPIGGVARLERMSEKPLEELLIAIAGPAVNFVIAVGLASALLAGALIQPLMVPEAAYQFLMLIAALNFGLFVFNLAPAFPMDGGRVLRAILALRLGRLQATRVAVYVSIGMAVLFGVMSVSFWHNPMLMLIGLFVIWAGQQELQHLELREQEHESAEHAESEYAEQPGAGHWPGVPSTAVTIYLWDPRRHAWVPQGVVQPHGRR